MIHSRIRETELQPRSPNIKPNDAFEVTVEARNWLWTFIICVISSQPNVNTEVLCLVRQRVAATILFFYFDEQINVRVTYVSH